MKLKTFNTSWSLRMSPGNGLTKNYTANFQNRQALIKRITWQLSWNYDNALGTGPVINNHFMTNPVGDFRLIVGNADTTLASNFDVVGSNDWQWVDFFNPGQYEFSSWFARNSLPVTVYLWNHDAVNWLTIRTSVILEIEEEIIYQ